MRFREGSVFLDLVETLADRRVLRIADIDVRARPRVDLFVLLLEETSIFGPELKRDAFLSEQTGLDVVLLLADCVVARSRISEICLLGERSVCLVRPDVLSAACNAHELVGVLRADDRVVVRGLHLASEHRGAEYWKRSVVRSRSWHVQRLLTLANRYLRQKHRALALCVEVFAVFQLLLVVAGTWEVLRHNNAARSETRVKNFALALPRSKVPDRRFELHGVQVGVVKSWPNCVLRYARVRVRRDFLGRNRRRF